MIDIHNWYWKRGDGAVYSSLHQAYIENDEASYREFILAGEEPLPFPVDDTPTRNESEEELRRLLESHGVEMFKPSPQEMLHRAKVTKKGSIDENTNRIRDRDGLSHSGERFSMTEGAKLNWTALLAASSMLTFPMTILTIDDKPFELADKNALMSFLMAVMAYDTAAGSPVTSGRELRSLVESAQTMEEVDVIVDDRE